MTEQEFNKIHETLIDLTRSKRLPWKRVDQRKYQLEFSRSSISIELEDDGYGNFAYTMNVYNEDGKLIASSSPFVGDSSSIKQFNLDASELYGLIDAQEYKVTETTKNILEELHNLKNSSRQ